MSSYDPEALDEFIQLLENFRGQCGGPSLRELVQASQRVVAEPRYKRLDALSLTTLSNVLTRKRVRPPRFRWVAVFVLACQRFAADSRLCPDPGTVTLAEWNRRLQAVQRPPPDTAGQADEQPDSADQNPAPVDHGSEPTPRPTAEPPAPRRAPQQPASAPPAQPLAAPPPDDRPRHASADDPGAGPASRLRTAPPDAAANHAGTLASVVNELIDDYVGYPGGASLSELRMFQLYGQHGVRLLQAAERHQDPDACFRLGVLLCVDHRPVEALAWLMQAEQHGHPKASELIETTTPRQQAMACAYNLGTVAAATGDPGTAEVYLKRLAYHGHAGAAFHLATVWLELEDHARATFWFTRAAEYGHSLGRWWANMIHTKRKWEQPATTPQPIRSISVPTLDELLEEVLNSAET